MQPEPDLETCSMRAIAAMVASMPLSNTQIQRISPAALAYLGDAVYELYVRTQYMFPPQRIRQYHQQVVAHVNADRQAQHLQSLLPHLTEFEQDLLRRGRNAAPRRSKRIDPEAYQQATGFETLMGYLYLTDPQRLLQLLQCVPLKLEVEQLP